MKIVKLCAIGAGGAAVAVGIALAISRPGPMGPRSMGAFESSAQLQSLPRLDLALPAAGTASASVSSAVVASPALASSPWLDDIVTGIRQAAETHRDVLVEFTAPILSEEARQIDAAVFDRLSFQQAAAKDFALVRLAPDSSGMTDPKVSELAERFNVGAFPTIVLLDASGRAFAKWHSESNDPGVWQDQIARLRAIRLSRDAAFAAAETSTGIERARHLDAGLVLISSVDNNSYLDIMRKVVESDPTNATGLKSKYLPTVVRGHVDFVVQHEVYPLIDKGEINAAIRRIDGLIGDVRPVDPLKNNLQMLLAFKGQLYNRLGDNSSALHSLDEAISAAPGSDMADRIRTMRQQMAMISQGKEGTP